MGSPIHSNGLLNFDRSATESASYAVILPRQYREHSSVRVTLHWQVEETANAAVVWKLSTQLGNPGSAFAAAQTLEMTATALGPDIHLRHSFDDMTLTEALIDSGLKITLSRQAGHSADTLSADAGLLAIDMVYQADSHGSYKEDEK